MSWQSYRDALQQQNSLQAKTIYEQESLCKIFSQKYLFASPLTTHLKKKSIGPQIGYIKYIWFASLIPNINDWVLNWALSNLLVVTNNNANGIVINEIATY